MSYRPIADVWILARPKVKYFGSFPSGFLERARALMGVSTFDPVLHVCSGKIRDYPFRGLGPNDRTLDLDPALQPDFLMDARQLGVREGDLFPLRALPGMSVDRVLEVEPFTAKRYLEPTRPDSGFNTAPGGLWPAVLTDPPYSEDEADEYVPGRAVLPEPTALLRQCLSVVDYGRRVGFLHRQAPRPPKENVRLVAMITVIVGYNNDSRIFSVYEREDPVLAKRERKRAGLAVRGAGLAVRGKA